jgi:hypothetical protein
MLIHAVACICVAVVEPLVRRRYEARVQPVELTGGMLVVGHDRGSATKAKRGLPRSSATM